MDIFTRSKQTKSPKSAPNDYKNEGGFGRASIINDGKTE
jgi:hypothetical protein